MWPTDNIRSVLQPILGRERPILKFHSSYVAPAAAGCPSKKPARLIPGARLCLKDQPQHLACAQPVAFANALRLVLRTQPRSARDDLLTSDSPRARSGCRWPADCPAARRALLHNAAAPARGRATIGRRDWPAPGARGLRRDWPRGFS